MWYCLIIYCHINDIVIDDVTLRYFLGKVLVRDERFKERKITGDARIYYGDNVLFC